MAKLKLKEMWEKHQHLIDLGKCDNSCDDWLECSQDWKSDKQWGKIITYGKNKLE